MRALHFHSDEEFGAFYAMLHFGVVIAANLHRDRTLADVEREAVLDDALAAVSDDGQELTPAGSRLRHVRARCAVAVTGETLAMVDRYVRYAAEKCAPDFARVAAVALRVVRRAAETAESEP